LNQLTHSAVASSSYSMIRQGLRALMSSVLYRFLMFLASALSWQLHCAGQGLDDRFSEPLTELNRRVSIASITIVDNIVRIKDAISSMRPDRVLDRFEHRRCGPVSGTCRPRSRRAQASVTNATQANADTSVAPRRHRLSRSCGPAAAHRSGLTRPSAAREPVHRALRIH
jgi:hypothetical protein